MLLVGQNHCSSTTKYVVYDSSPKNSMLNQVQCCYDIPVIVNILSSHNLSASTCMNIARKKNEMVK